MAPAPEHDLPGVFWIFPKQRLNSAFSVLSAGELCYLLDYYDPGQEWEANQARLGEIQASLISAVVSEGPEWNRDVVGLHSFESHDGLFGDLRRWAEGRVITVYLDPSTDPEEAERWAEALDAAVVRVRLPKGQRAQIVAA
jgi:hypothetical protein